MIKTLLINIAVGILPTTMLAQNAIPGYTINTSTEASTVSTEYGKVAGYIENGIYNYKGIPYAQAERFEEPHAPKPWNGVRSSRHYGPTCPQSFARCGTWTTWRSRRNGTMVSQARIVCASTSGLQASTTARSAQ